MVIGIWLLVKFGDPWYGLIGPRCLSTVDCCMWVTELTSDLEFWTLVGMRTLGDPHCTSGMRGGNGILGNLHRLSLYNRCHSIFSPPDIFSSGANGLRVWPPPRTCCTRTETPPLGRKLWVNATRYISSCHVTNDKRRLRDGFAHSVTLS